MNKEFQGIDDRIFSIPIYTEAIINYDSKNSDKKPILKSEKVINIKATSKVKAHKRRIKGSSEIDKVNRIYNQLCNEMGIMSTFISDLGRLKQRVEELKVKARKNPSSMYYMT